MRSVLNREIYHNFFHLFVYYGKFGKIVDEILDENFLLLAVCYTGQNLGIASHNYF